MKKKKARADTRETVNITWAEWGLTGSSRGRPNLDHSGAEGGARGE